MLVDDDKVRLEPEIDNTWGDIWNAAKGDDTMGIKQNYRKQTVKEEEEKKKRGRESWIIYI
jgi:hypothetical protein